jgi:hypothetical protein
MGRTLLPAGRKRPRLLAGMLGFLTGLSLCPPFLMALAGASGGATLVSSLLFFVAFFMATTLFFVPFPLAAALSRSRAAQTVGRLAAGLTGVYYLYRGLIMIYGGLKS